MSSQTQGPLEYTYAQANSPVDATIFRREFSGGTLFIRSEFGNDNFTVSSSWDAAALWSSPREVSEYALLFWIFCFIINAFTQPSGAVLQLHGSKAAVLRCFPLLYAIDALAALVHFVALLAIRQEGPRRASSIIMNERLPCGTAEQTKDTLKEVKDDASKRITAFLLGVAPSFAKLLGCTISPAFKALGACYMVPWVLFELLLALATPDADINWGSDSVRIFPAFRGWHLRRKLGKGAAIAQAILLAVPFILHAVRAISARLQLKGFLGELAVVENSLYQACLVFSVISALIGLSLGFGATVLESDAGTPRLTEAIDRNRWFAPVITGSVYANLAFILDNVILTGMGITVEAGDSAALHVVSISLGTGGAALMFTPIAARDLKWQLDLATYLQVLYGFVALLTCILVLYDSDGTLQPDWLDYLG
jgi:hypothetical protein